MSSRISSRNRALLLTALVSSVALTACGDRRVFSSWTQEAGVFLDANSSLGTPTANNMAYHTGERNFTVDLNNRFNRDIQTTVNFAFNSAELDADARAILQVQANWIKQFPEVKFKVYGHTDAVGSNAYNKRLGKRRANAVVAFLVAQGVHRSRLQAVVSFGETRPLIATQAQERQNRRTVTEVAGFIRRTPTTLNGKYADIIFREYVDSATEASTNDDSGLAAIAGQAGGG